MLITRKKQVPIHWAFYAQIPFVMAIAANYVTGAPFLFAMKKFIDNPAAITFLLSIEVFVTTFGGPFSSWLSDRIWTKYGRRKIFVVLSNIPQAAACILMPFAPNLISLIVLRWIYGIAMDIGAPNQALTMEVIPTKQRGLGVGFFQSQMNIVNLVFFGTLFGRLDDVYFTGPFFELAKVSGETLVFLAGAILLISICFYTFYGMHEVKPPTRKKLADDRRPGENVVFLFLRSFFSDVFARDLLPLYLLLVVNSMAGVSLGILSPLLFTEQWGYSKQDMGTNIAVGAAFGIFISLAAGYVADRTSKMKVYIFALTAGVCIKMFWTGYVWFLPDQRPSLVEIIFQGNIQFIFSQLAGVVSFPLILEYVERNRLGTAGAGMAVFNSTVRNALTMVVGPYILIWSIFFLPQAGDRIELVFAEEKDRPALVEAIGSIGEDVDQYDVSPLHRPGVDSATSRHWDIRRSIEGFGNLHSDIKDLTNKIGELSVKKDSPFATEEELAALNSEISYLRDRRNRIETELNESALAFEEKMRGLFGDKVVSDGSQLLDFEFRDNGRFIRLDLEIVEPLDPDQQPDETAAWVKAIRNVMNFEFLRKEEPEIIPQLTELLDTVDVVRLPGEVDFEFVPALQVSALEGPVNGIRIEVERDADYLNLEKSMLRAGVSPDQASELASGLLLPIRGAFGQLQDDYEISNLSLTLEDEILEMRFTVTGNIDPGVVDNGADPELLFSEVEKLQSLTADGQWPTVTYTLLFEGIPEYQFEPTGITLRMQALSPDELDMATLESLSGLYDRIRSTAAARPIFLTVAEPVVRAEPSDRKYDYFFSMQYFMIITDFFGIAVVILILYLERRGVVRRHGAEEDANR